MRRYLILALFIAFSSAAQSEKSAMLVDRGFRDDNTCYIVCKGFPDSTETNETKKIGTAREAALLNAQIIAREMFDNSVDVVRNGLVEKYEQFKDYVVIYYVIRQEGLSSKLRISPEEMMK